MYYSYTRHNISPSVFFKMGEGERIIMRAFMLKEIEENEEAIASIKTIGKGG